MEGEEERDRGREVGGGEVGEVRGRRSEGG
jgi:hypothetical protein